MGKYRPSDGYRALLFLLLGWNLGGRGFFFVPEDVFPVLEVLVQVIFEGASRVEFLECIMQHVQVLVGTIRTQLFIDERQVLSLEGFSLNRVVDFEDAEHSHDVCAFGLVGLLGHHWRNYCLEVGANGNKSMPVILQRYFSGRNGGIHVFCDKDELLILDILVPGQRGLDELPKIGVIGGPAVKSHGLRDVLILTVLVLHLTVLL